ncbi:hypothetical protein [Methylobacterium marchantiae]|uniref:Uncharacterized protein n=1 Tax=Methylobacterium marchantiae TaxID=600331 RepID=A0ABW3X3Y6_9HYPH|nr:hypothetical protein AIGOOFII_4085 [Methylobacterium marchantiae]
MRFPGAQVIAIDDQLNDLQGIVSALQSTGVGVLPFHYKGSRSIRRCHPGVRIVFSDIGLIASAGPPIQQHRAVAAVLDTVLVEENGPWLLIAWTAAPNQVPDLHNVLLDSLGARAPIKSIPLSKNNFLDARGKFKIKEIAIAINTEVSTDPVVGAIFDLEIRAASAARDISRSIADLASHGQSNNGGPTIADVLKALSKAVDGGEPRPENVFQAVAPAFGDRLVRKVIRSSERQLWSEAFGCATTATLNDDQKAELNTSLHLDPSGSAGERGALSRVPIDLHSVLQRLIGCELTTLIHQHFLKADKTKKSLVQSWKLDNPNSNTSQQPIDEDLFDLFAHACRWWLLEVVPACDVSNQKRGMRRALVCLGVPHFLGNQDSAGDHVVKLPTLKLDGELIGLYATAKVTLSPPPRQIGKIKPLGRLRDQLLDGVMQHVANSQSRLGWTSF